MNNAECPRCGNQLEPEQKCQTCGYDPSIPMIEIVRKPVKIVRKPVSKVTKVVSILAFLLIGLPSCFVGGCFIVVTGLVTPHTGPQQEPLLIAVGALLIFALLLWWMIEANRKR